MIASDQDLTSSTSAAANSPNGHTAASADILAANRATARWTQFGPFIVSSLVLILGYLHYSPGAEYSLSAEHYRAWSFPSFRYSDLIWLYLRDELDRRPIPYVDYQLEYPPVTGMLSWLLSFAPDLPAYFALAYALLGASALLTVWALQRLGGANVWLFAASPALFFYTGHQWDMVAIGITALGLLAFQRGRDGWGIAALIVATSLKLFPVAFVAAAIVERIRDRRFGSAAGLALAFGAGTVAINLPLAVFSFEGWSFFFRWNRDRLADSGIWVLWRSFPTAELTRWSLVAAVIGGIALTIVGLRSRGPLFIPLGATYLLWWLLINKTFTTHLMLWAILSVAVLSAPWWIWGLVTAIDVVGFQLGNYLNLYNIPEYRHSPLIRKAVENIYDPVQIARSAVLLVCTFWGVHVLSVDRLRSRFLTTPVGLSSSSWTRRISMIQSETTAAPRIEVGRALFAAGIGAAFCAAAVAMTWPYALHLSDSTIVGFDPFLQIWLSEWIQHALSTNPLGLYNANIFYPFSQTLAYTDANIPGALIAAPIRWLSGDPIVTNSILVLASFVLAAASVFALVLHLTGNRAAGFIAGLAYASLPYRMVHLWHLNWLEAGLLPLLVLFLLRLLDRPTLMSGAALGGLSATLLLVSFYFSVQIALLCSIFVVVRSVALRRFLGAEHMKALGLAVVVAAIVAIPVLVPYLNVRNEQQLERTIADAEQYKALPESYLQLAPWDTPNLPQTLFGVRAGPNASLTEVGQALHADGHQHTEIVIEDALFPGVFALIFAVIGAVAGRTRRWVAIALILTGLVALLLSLGPTFGPRHGNGFPLPYGWLFDHIPFLRSMRVPARLGGLTNLTIVVLAGLGLAWSWDRVCDMPAFVRVTRHFRFRLIVMMLISVLVLADLWAGGAPLEAVDRGPEASSASAWLAAQPAGAVMEFPAESVFADPAAASVRRHYGETLFWSTRHWKPLVNGNSGFIPRAYSDFIERFVSEIARPDGSTTPRISHVDRETIRLLDQIGVRYLVFHRSKYRVEDWPAITSVLDELGEDGSLTPGGEHGEASIYLVNPTAPSVAKPHVRLYAPTLLTPDAAWSPWIAVESPSGTPSVLAFTRPSQLEMTWYDDQGRRLWKSSQHVPLPAVLDDPRLLCGASECMTSRPFDDPGKLPPPDRLGSWNPGQTGHFVVRLRLSGDYPLECTVDTDVVEDKIEVRKRSAENSFRWAECVDISQNPVNNPGARPFTLASPSVTFVGREAVVDIAVTSRIDEEIRGWFVLAPPGVAEPWNHAAFQSQVQQKLSSAGDPTAYKWSAEIGSEVDPGVYGLTVWFHRRGPSGWEHAIGGDIDLAPIVVSEEGTLRWAGPIRARLAHSPKAIVPGRAAQLELTIGGVSNRVECMASWKLYDARNIVAQGNAESCTAPGIVIRDNVRAGHYRLEIDLFAVRDDQRFLSDALSVAVVVVENADALGPS